MLQHLFDIAILLAYPSPLLFYINIWSKTMYVIFGDKRLLYTKH